MQSRGIAEVEKQTTCSCCCAAVKCNLVDITPWLTDFILYSLSVVIAGLGLAQYSEKHATPFAWWLALWFVALWYSLTASGVSKAYAEAVRRLDGLDLSANQSVHSQYLRVQLNRFPSLDKSVQRVQDSGLSFSRYVRYTLMSLVFGVGFATGAYIHAATSVEFHSAVNRGLRVGLSSSYQERWYSGFIVLSILQLAVNFLPVVATVMSFVLVTR